MKISDDGSPLAQLEQSDGESLRSTSSPIDDTTTTRSESTDISRPDANNEEQQEIERWSTQIIHALAACDFENPVMQRLIPDFKSDREMVAGVEYQPRSKAEYFAKHRGWAKTTPNRTMTVLDVVSDYNRDKGKADVWIWISVTGWGSARMCAESVSCFKWKRSQSVWWCHQHTGIRGTPPIQAFY